LTLTASSLNAQLYKGFGVKVGTTIANQHITYPTNILTVGNEYYDPNKDMKYKAGLTFGLFKEIHIVENLKTQIGINYARKGYFAKWNTEFSPEDPVNVTTNIDFITSEIYAKYDILKKDIKPYLLAGLRLDFYLSLKSYYDDNTEVIFISNPITNDIILGASFGVGVEFKTSKLTNIFIEAALNPDITYLIEYNYDYKYRGHSFDIRTGIKF
jgi:hypothetical protein